MPQILDIAHFCDLYVCVILIAHFVLLAIFYHLFGFVIYSRKKGMLVGNETAEMLKRVKTKLNTGQKNQSSIAVSHCRMCHLETILTNYLQGLVCILVK